MEKHFSAPMYESLYKYAKQVMDAHPEITDELVVGFAANQMEECADDGAELSVDDALRLTAKHNPIPTAKDFYNSLMNAGVNTQSDLISLLESGFDGVKKPISISASVAERAAKMTMLGREICNGNKDIVLMGTPIDLSWEFSQLKVAFFTEDLSEREKEIIKELKSLADETEYYEKFEIGYAIFRIYTIK